MSLRIPFTCIAAASAQPADRRLQPPSVAFGARHGGADTYRAPLDVTPPVCLTQMGSRVRHDRWLRFRFNSYLVAWMILFVDERGLLRLFLSEMAYLWSAFVAFNPAQFLHLPRCPPALY
jgi:hypothetical protein